MPRSSRRESTASIRVPSMLATTMFFEVEIEGAYRTLAEFDRSEAAGISFVRAHHAGGGFRAIRSDDLIADSGCNDFFIALVLSGTVGIIQEGRRADVTRGQMVLIDTGRSCAIELGESGNVLWVRFPRDRIAPGFLSIEERVGRVIPNEGIGYVAARTFLASAWAATDIDEGSATTLADVCCTMLIALLRANADRDDCLPTRDARATLRRIEHLIEENLADETLSVSWIAQQSELSKRYVARLFAKKGISVKRWIAQRRLHQCRQLLIDSRESGRSIKQIAYGCGFATVPHFNRLFRRHFGCSPTQFRKAGAAARLPEGRSG